MTSSKNIALHLFTEPPSSSPREFRPLVPFIYYKPNPISSINIRVQPHALQTFCHPSDPFQRRRLSFPSRVLFGLLTIPQVKAVVAPSDDLILSASRDSTAISWIRGSDSSFSPVHTFRAGPRYINAVAYLKPTPEAPQGKNMSCWSDCRPPLTIALQDTSLRVARTQ